MPFQEALATTAKDAFTSPGRRLSTIAAILPLCILIMSSACGKPGSTAVAKEANEEAAAEKEVSDLDRPVEDLFAAVCEHGIPQYTCAECRYEVGVARVAPDLLNDASGRGFSLATAERRDVLAGQDLNGEVRLNEERSVWLSPRAPGVVRTIGVDLGARVSQGQSLFEVESAELRQAKADYVRALASATLAEAAARREADLFERKICPKKDLLEAQAAQRQAEAEVGATSGLLASFGLSAAEVEGLQGAAGRATSGVMPVRAPFPGTVLERSLSLGALVQPGDKLLLLADTSRVWVLTALHENEVAGVLEAQGKGAVTAEVAVGAYPGKVFRGVVDKVEGTLDEATRTARARVVVENPEGLLRAGMFASVRIPVAGGEKAVCLPRESVMEDGGRAFVFVRHDAEYFVRRPVKTGRAWGDWVEVTEGLKGGEVVVCRGAFLLKSDVLRSKMGAGCAD